MMFDPELYRLRRMWADLFIPNIQQILGAKYFPIGNEQEDMDEDTDIKMRMFKSRVSDERFAVRTRTKYAYEHWPTQFTVRESHESGARTEIDKILDGGKSMYYFYSFSSINFYHLDKGFINSAETKNRHLVYWFVGRMDVLRDFLLEMFEKYPDRDDPFWADRRCRVDENGDNFLWFEQAEVPGFVIDSSLNWHLDPDTKLWTKHPIAI